MTNFENMDCQMRYLEQLIIKLETKQAAETLSAVTNCKKENKCIILKFKIFFSFI